MKSQNGNRLPIAATCAVIIWSSALDPFTYGQELAPPTESSLSIRASEPLSAETIPGQAREPIAALTFDEALNIAFANNPRLRQAAGEIERARGATLQAGLYPNPTFDSGGPNFQMGGAATAYTAGVTQEIVRGGKLRLSRAAAEQHAAAMDMQYAAERRNLERDVRVLFLDILADQMRLDLFNALWQLSLSTEQTTDRLFQAGQASRTDVLLIRTQRREAEAAAESLAVQLAGQKRRFAAVIGVPSLNIVRLDGDLTWVPPFIDDESSVQAAVTQHPQVRSARFDIARGRYALDRALVEPVPNISVQSGFNYALERPHTQALLGFYFDIPVWDRNQGNIRSARGELSSSTARYEVVQNELTAELVATMARFRAADGRLRSFESGILPDAQEGLRLVREGYESGQFDLFRLLQAQKAFSEAEFGRLSALHERAQAAAEIVRLTGSADTNY